MEEEGAEDGEEAVSGDTVQGGGGGGAEWGAERGEPMSATGLRLPRVMSSIWFCMSRLSELVPACVLGGRY